MLVILESVVHDTSDAEPARQASWRHHLNLFQFILIYFNLILTKKDRIPFWSSNHTPENPIFLPISDLTHLAEKKRPAGSAASQFFGSTESPKGLKLRPTGEGLRDLQHPDTVVNLLVEKKPPESSKTENMVKNWRKKTGNW